MQKLLTVRRIVLTALLGLFLSACNQVIDINDIADLNGENLPRFLQDVIENMQENSRFALTGEMFNGDSFEGLFVGENFYLKSESEDDQSEVYRFDGDVYVYADLTGEGLVWVKFTKEDEAADFTKDVTRAADFFGDDTSESTLAEQYSYIKKEQCPSGQSVCYSFEVKDDDGTTDRAYLNAVSKLPDMFIDNTAEGKTEISFDYESGVNIELPEEAKNAKTVNLSL